MKKISMKEIAKLANVSIGTVDRVLHNRGRVSPHTQEKILKIIKDKNYHPNIYARNLKLSKIFNFGVIMPEPHQDSAYWNLPYIGIERAAGELKSLNVKIHYFFFDKFNEYTLKARYNEAIEKQMDGLIVAPVFWEESKRIFQFTPDTLPYIFFDTFIPGVKPVSIVGQDSFKAGRLAGSLMKLLRPQGARIAVFGCFPQDYHIDQRIKGFKEYLKVHQDFSIEHIDILEEDRLNDFKRIALFAQQHNSEINGLFIPHSNTHLIVHQFISPGRKKMATIGFDLIKENVQLLNSGKIDFLISQRPTMQGYQSVYTLYRHIILNENVPEKIHMPLEIINRENIEASNHF